MDTEVKQFQIGQRVRVNAMGNGHSAPWIVKYEGATGRIYDRYVQANSYLVEYDEPQYGEMYGGFYAYQLDAIEK